MKVGVKIVPDPTWRDFTGLHSHEDLVETVQDKSDLFSKHSTLDELLFD